MSRQDWYELGQQFRRYLIAGTGVQARAPQGTDISGKRYAPEMDRAAGVVGLFNQAARLKPGHLLVVYLGRNACYQVNPESGEIEYLFSLGHEQSPFLWRVVADRKGRIYCTISGAKDEVSRDAVFGLAGAILRVDTRLANIEAIATGDSIVDPCGMEFLDEARLLVSDFGGFGASGAVYTVDRIGGDIRVLATGGLLRDPVSAIMDEEGVIWVANSYMHYHYPERSGTLEKDDGEILRITPDHKQTIVVSRQSPASGSMVGIHPSNHPNQIIAIKGDWPLMENGAVLRIDKYSGAVDELLSASPMEPRFYSTHVGISNDILWVGESYQKQIIGFDLSRNEVAYTIDFSGIMGPYRGVASSFEGIESVSVVPSDLEI